jgi:hypothetical protein
MQNKNTRSISGFNNELKLKGFNVFQIEIEGSAQEPIAERISIKYV